MVVNSSEDWELMLVAPFVVSFYNTAIVYLFHFCFFCPEQYVLCICIIEDINPIQSPILKEISKKKSQSSFLLHCEESLNHSRI